jgi:hypothetical protein
VFDWIYEVGMGEKKVERKGKVEEVNDLGAKVLAAVPELFLKRGVMMLQFEK